MVNKIIVNNDRQTSNDPYFSYIRNPDRSNQQLLIYNNNNNNNNNNKFRKIGLGFILYGSFVILKKYINI